MGKGKLNHIPWMDHGIHMGFGNSLLFFFVKETKTENDHVTAVFFNLSCALRLFNVNSTTIHLPN